MITGAAGLLGTVLSRGLSGRYAVSGVDRRSTRAPDVRRVPASVFDGVDAVIDLAGLPEASVPWVDVWRNNLPATMNALEAARRSGVRRFVYASSNRVTGMYERDLPYSAIVTSEYGSLDPRATPLIRADWPVRPDGPYAVGKVLGEAAARYYSDAFGLSAICLRIGTVTADDRPHEARHFSTLLTHADLVRLAEAALEAPDDVQFGVYYGVSRNTWRFWDIDAARAELGYDPHDDAERFRDLVGDWV
jgi:nucleoside-diphosphate-sugar epimerase